MDRTSLMDQRTMMRRDNFTAERLFQTDTPLDAFGAPEILEIEPIHLCNFRCVMCHVAHEDLSKQMVNFSALRRSVESMPGLRGKWAILGATHEPMLHPDFPEIVALLTEAGMKIDLTTNGSMLTDRMISQIQGGRFAQVTVSFDGATAASYERIRARASYQHTLDRVTAFKDAIGNACTYWSVNYTVLKSNVAEIGAAVDLWEGKGFDSLGFIAMEVRHPSMQAEALSSVQAEFRRALYNAAEKVILAPYRIAIGSSLFVGSDLALRYPGNVRGNLVVSDHPEAISPLNCRPHFQNGYHPDVPVPCRAPYKHARISFGNEVLLCNQHSIGKITDAPLADLWAGAEAARIRGEVKRGALCPSCAYYRLCINAATVRPFA